MGNPKQYAFDPTATTKCIDFDARSGDESKNNRMKVGIDPATSKPWRFDRTGVPVKLDANGFLMPAADAETQDLAGILAGKTFWCETDGDEYIAVYDDPETCFGACLTDPSIVVKPGDLFDLELTADGIYKVNNTAPGTMFKVVKIYSEHEPATRAVTIDATTTPVDVRWGFAPEEKVLVKIVKHTNLAST